MAKNKSKPQRLQTLQPEKHGSMGSDVLDEFEDEDEDVEIDVAKDQVQIVNMYQGTVNFQVAGRKYKMKPGDVMHVEVAYGTPRVMRKGADPIPSVVELETGRKVLPVLDPRVDKDEDGVPLITRQMQARREQRRREMNERVQLPAQ